MRAVGFRASILATAALGLAGCSEPPGRTNVVLVVCDTLRADELGCYGNTRGLTPNLDALAGRGALFEHAYAHAPWTLPSASSILTGLPPEEHGAGGRLGRYTPLAPGVETLPGILAAGGYRTHGIVSVIFLAPRFGATRDFATLDQRFTTDNRGARDADEVTDAALRWIDRHRDEPFFLLVHYFDPHAVYAPPQPFRRRFADPRDREDESFAFATSEHMTAVREGSLALTPALMQRAHRLYQGEVAFADAEIGRLAAGIEARGLAERTALVVTADHGEEFLDHGGYEHGHTLYDELLHVPLIVSWPGTVPERTRVEAAVGLVDLAPTVCGIAGQPPPRRASGQDLLSLTRGEVRRPAPLLAHGNMWGPPLSSLREGEYKLIRGADGRDELYHAAVDPGETHDLAALEPERCRALGERLERLETALGSRAATPLRLTPQERAVLESTGYAGSGDEE